MWSALCKRRVRSTVLRLQMKRKLDDVSEAFHVRAMTSIQLNPREKQLKCLLLDVAAFIDKSGSGFGSGLSRTREPVVLRWAGGWVRDKLLGIESHDIDTAVNVMTGYAFAMKMKEFCEEPQNRARHNMSKDDLGNLHKVKKNPEKSKNLETGTTSIFGLEIDFVNLRKETYSEDSRNPDMEFGTAEEDAERRDATVNALFYNLHTGEIEDFTGGLRDMDAKLIRTPLEPLKTFMDDPLRVLRLVRFASRLGYRIDADAEKVMGDSRVLDALRLKISRERVGIEVDKMLKGKHPGESLLLIDRLGLYHTVFTDPGRTDMPKPDISKWRNVYRCLDSLVNSKTPGSFYDVLVRSEEASYFAWILAALVPWEYVPDVPLQAKKKLPMVTLAAREGIKATNKVCDLVTAAHRNRQTILALKELVDNRDESMHERDRFGMAIREWDSRGGYWRLQVLYAALTDIFANAEADSEIGRTQILAGWQQFLDHLQELDVMDAPSIKRLIDGKELARALGIKPGVWMTKALETCMAWQLRNPNETDPSGAIEELRRRKGELGL